MTEQTIKQFEVALGEEDGQSFAAIMWPEPLGQAPFSSRASIIFTPTGFALFETDESQAVEFSDVEPSIMNEMRVRHIVILERDAGEFKQIEVIKSDFH